MTIQKSHEKVIFITLHPGLAGCQSYQQSQRICLAGKGGKSSKLQGLWLQPWKSFVTYHVDCLIRIATQSDHCNSVLK